MDYNDKKRQALLERKKKSWKESFSDAITGTGKKTQGMIDKTIHSKKENELEKITNEIKFDLDNIDRIISTVEKKKMEYKTIQKTVIKRLLYIKDNNKLLLNKMNFIEYLKDDNRALKLIDDYLKES